MAKSKPNYYAVATGRRPGIYKDWLTCSAQVTGFSGSKFKGHGTLDEAKQWMRACDAEQYAVVIEISSSASHISPIRLEPNVSASSTTSDSDDVFSCSSSDSSESKGFRSTWRPYGELSQEVRLQLTQEIRASHGHDVKSHVIKQEYERRRTRAMHHALEKRFFMGATSRLKGYQALCRAVRIEPSDTVKECRDDLRGTLVNIVDLLEALDFDKPVKVWLHEEWSEFVAYTRDPENCFHIGEAKRSEYLRCFLQKLALKEPRRRGNPRPLQTVAEPAMPDLAPTSPACSAEIKEEEQYEGLGRLSPLASECIYDDGDKSVLAMTRTRKRSSQHMEHGEVDEDFETKRPRLASNRRFRASQAISLANEAKAFENLDDTIPSAQGQDPDVVDD